MAFAPSIFRHVAVTKVRGTGKTREVRGWLVAPLSVGGRLVVRQDDDRQLTSTAIRRMLVEDPEAQVVFLETQNSSYRIRFLGGENEIAPPAKAVRVQVDDDSREITLVEELAGESTTQPHRK
ncbi:MAG: hypothetical protein ACXVCV_08160 [Polyangia bacterium]